MSQSPILEAAADQVVQDLASDVRPLLSGGDLDAVPPLKALRQRVRAKVAIAREITSGKSKLAASKAKELATTANDYAHAKPWQIVLGALSVGIVLGLLLNRRESE